MIELKPLTLGDKSLYEHKLFDGNERGCEYTFANLFLWGKAKMAVLHDQIVLFSQFNHGTYLYPIGSGDKKAVLDAIIDDAKARGIACRISGLLAKEKEILEELYPGMFRFHTNRDWHDYVYAIDDLADLQGKKYHRRRNHYNRFRDTFPDYTVEPLGDRNLHKVREMVNRWYEVKLTENPEGDFQMEQVALENALHHFRELDMVGLVLLEGKDVLAVTLGSRSSEDTFDVHFEKARSDANGAYAAINCEFARYIRERFPLIRFLNREEDMGLEGLRQAKQRYYPHHMVEKYWACLVEDDGDED